MLKVSGGASARAVVHAGPTRIAAAAAMIGMRSRRGMRREPVPIVSTLRFSELPVPDSGTRRELLAILGAVFGPPSESPKRSARLRGPIAEPEHEAQENPARQPIVLSCSIRGLLLLLASRAVLTPPAPRRRGPDPRR